MNDRVLISGASGLLGSTLGIKLSASGYDVLGIRHSHPRNLPFPEVILDLTDNHVLSGVFRDFKPTTVVHCAALSKVLECQKNPETAHTLNVAVTRKFTELADDIKSYLIFISTDQVFDGKSGRFSETDIPAPTHVYGQTKLEAENIVAGSSSDNLILRSNNIVGNGAGWGAGFTEGLLQKFLAKESVSLFTDQFRSPICVDIMTNVISGCIRKRIGGILHGGGPERLSRYDTGTKLLSAYGLSPELLQSSSFKSHPQAEFLHEDGSFDTTKLKSLFPEYANETIYEGFRRDAAARTI